MSRLFYYTMRTLGRPIFQVASRARLLHAERVPRRGPFLLVANHESTFDAVLLTACTPRMVHWLGAHEIFQRPLGRWFFTGMGARPLDRTRPDPAAVRGVVRDLRAGRAVGIFPQGAVRAGDFVATEGRMPEALARLAELTRAPLLPCVILGAEQFRRWPAWLPGRRTRWVAAYGEPITLSRELERPAARETLLAELARSLRALYEEARPHAPGA